MGFPRPLRFALATIIACLALHAATVVAAPLESGRFRVNGVNIHYVLAGSGTPVVLIHGWHSSIAMNWQAPGIIAALSRNHQVIAIDLPGYGQSDKPGDEAAYGKQWVDDVIALLDHLGIAKAHIVGYSLGGIIALKFIVDHPDRAISGVLGGMGWLPEGGPVEKIWASMREPGGRSVAQLGLTEAQVRAVKVPVVILVGDHDPVRKLYVAPLQRVRPDWPVIDIAGAGHASCIFKTQFTDEIERWIDARSR
ncbi:MAG TPA: alpha/beta fold hydrolase [Casimicrobiaceae bacterium]|nr:alpha/beta fold hydrolase [Casimicrobiaceae bacterium]